MSGNTAPGGRRIAQNRKARRDYHLERPFEVGIRLTGTEVKSLRAGRANINDAYATERGGEVFLINAHIAQYDGAGPFNHDPLRPRKLLLHKREIRKLVGGAAPWRRDPGPARPLLQRARYRQVALAMASGKRKYDKRAAEKARDCSARRNGWSANADRRICRLRRWPRPTHPESRRRHPQTSPA